MSPVKMNSAKTLTEKYPPSAPCDCEICKNFCLRPGWWTVGEADRAISAGYAGRMMLEMSPDRSFGVLSPAFRGCERDFARDLYATRGCTFLHDGLCELHGTAYQPLECRFCHHDRPGQGKQCHADIEKDWNTPEGKSLVVIWSSLTGFLERKGIGVPRGR